ncbi:MAG: HupE/UreJ family protein, partial [Pseudomonadota bacterium]
IENLLAKYQLAWRSAIVFGFGLLHGLGFAGALSEFGLPDTHYASALIGFNLGVEIGQLSFALVVFVLLHRVLSKRNFFSYVFIPGNCVVALAGLYWLLERLAG